jgi:membrane peptidoglycan carboxypeptidase
MELANAYATLAADGKYCEPIPVQEIKGPDGKKLDVAKPRCKKVVSTDVARAAVDAARCPVGDNSSTSKCVGNRTAGNVRGIVDHPVAGKSGTTDSGKTAALVAMTKQLSVAGIMADPDWPQTTSVMGHNVPNGINPPVYQTLRDAMKGKPSVQFTPPSGKILEGDLKSVPDVKCRSVDSATSRLKDAGFEVTVDDRRIASSCPAGEVAGTTPDDRAVKGSLITIQVSNGQPASGNGNGGTPGSPPNRPTPGRPGG